MTHQILAVDDEPHMLSLLERIILEKTPYELTVTQNSLEVPELLDRSAYDLIITDLKMPGMDGLDILRMVKQRERAEEVIIITAFGTLDSAIEALGWGAFHYITKPFKKEKILQTIEGAIQKRAERRDTEEMARIFAIEPYDEACRAFESAYVRRLSGRANAQLDRMAERSGLSPETLKNHLED